MRDEQQRMSELITKKTRGSRGVTHRPRRQASNDLLKEYRFDYSKARPNRFAARAKQGYRTKLLDPDIAAVFTTTESVNVALCALIAVIPNQKVTSRDLHKIKGVQS